MVTRHKSEKVELGGAVVLTHLNNCHSSSTAPINRGVGDIPLALGSGVGELITRCDPTDIIQRQANKYGRERDE